MYVCNYLKICNIYTEILKAKKKKNKKKTVLHFLTGFQSKKKKSSKEVSTDFIFVYIHYTQTKEWMSVQEYH